MIHNYVKHGTPYIEVLARGVSLSTNQSAARRIMEANEDTGSYKQEM
jgi:hypothetical protein